MAPQREIPEVSVSVDPTERYHRSQSWWRSFGFFDFLSVVRSSSPVHLSRSFHSCGLSSFLFSFDSAFIFNYQRDTTPLNCKKVHREGKRLALLTGFWIRASLVRPDPLVLFIILLHIPCQSMSKSF